jgi:hypothetical protein
MKITSLHTLYLAQFHIHGSNFVMLSCFMYGINCRRHCLMFNVNKCLARMCSSLINLMLSMIVGTISDVNSSNSPRIKLVKVLNNVKIAYIICNTPQTLALGSIEFLTFSTNSPIMRLNQENWQ